MNNIRLTVIYFLIIVLFGLPAGLFAKEIKPGVTINRENLDQYLPEMEKSMDPGNYLLAVHGLQRGVITMPILKTRVYPQPQPFYDITTKRQVEARVGPNNELIGWEAGIPFLDPKTGAEAVWNLDRKCGAIDQATANFNMSLHGASGKLEREYKDWYWGAYYYIGRVVIPPIPRVPDNEKKIHFKEYSVLSYPFDVKGFSTLRTRYEDVFIPDDVFAYIPAIRRMRRLTGRDVCDPMAGSDVIYDDFEGFRQKITPKMTFKLNRRKLLFPVHVEKVPPFDYHTSDIPQVDWEFRDVYEIIISPNDSEYIYGRRVIYSDVQRKFFGIPYATLSYDMEGRLWRSFTMVTPFLDPPHYPGWPCCDIWYNARSMHHTVWFSPPEKRDNPDPDCRPSLFSFKYLLKLAR